MQPDPHNVPGNLHQLAASHAQAVTNSVMEALEVWRERTLRDQRELVVAAFEEAISAPDVVGDAFIVEGAAKDMLARWEGDRLIRIREGAETIDPRFIVG